jgi:methionyl-tRNA formyltransferase
MIVACAEGTLVKVEQVKSQGKKQVSVGDWWNGLSKSIRDGRTIKLE